MSLKRYIIDMSDLSSDEEEELMSILDSGSYVTRPISFNGLYESYWDEAEDLSKFPLLSRCIVKANP